MQKARAEEIRIPFGVGIAGVVAQSKEIINIKDAYQVGGLHYLQDDQMFPFPLLYLYGFIYLRSAVRRCDSETKSLPFMQWVWVRSPAG